MKILLTNDLKDLGIAATIVFVGFVIARYAGSILGQRIESGRLGLLSVARKKTLLCIPPILRLFIVVQGFLIAFRQLRFQSDFFEFAATVDATITTFGDVFLFLLLSIAFRLGFDYWTTRVATKQDSGRIVKARLLTNLMLLTIGFVILLRDIYSLPNLDFKFPQEEVLNVASFLLLITGSTLIFYIWSIQKRSAGQGTNKLNQAPSFPAELIASIEREDPDFPLIVDIANLFLAIVRHRLDAGVETPSRLTLVEHDTVVSKYLFDLEVHLYGNWKKRRFTVGRLAADSGSRSKCFYAIFDEYLVIKIPPEPISDSTEYIDSLMFEADIAEQIDLKECLIPTISVIMKYLDPSIDAQKDSLFSSEKRTMAPLKLKSELQRFLKVGDSFAYFMDMSEYYFLQNVTEMLHQANDTGDKVPFIRIKAPIEGIVANLLVLLAHLARKGVALRDLKPDNLLVAGDRNSYPHFLREPDEYMIGLIDIETAVIYGNPPRKWINQPILGGSPLYATPSHFFNNELIRQTEIFIS